MKTVMTTERVTGAPVCGIFFVPHPRPEEQAARPADEITEAQHLWDEKLTFTTL